MQSKGFTLIELSIVVVIIGLIVAGVVAGQSLVRQAKLRTIVSDFQKYDVSLNTFKLQYNSLPGDITNAYSFWGSSCHTSQALCNGDGDRAISSGDHEWAQIWRHLNLAGILPAAYTGVLAHPMASFSPTGPLKSVSSRTSGSVFAVTYQPTAFFQRASNALMLAASGDYNNGSIWDGLVLSPSEARSVDLKMDDGIAHRGELYGLSGQGTPNTSCSGLFTGTGADYNLSSTTHTCWLAKFIYP